MKSIIDIYSESVEIVSTPGNTTGMGNPMLPTAEEPGTEPIVPKKKKKCKECKKVTEASLLDIDGQIEAGDDLIEFVNWYIDSSYDCCKIAGHKMDANKEDAFNGMIKAISSPSKGVFSIDIEKAFDVCPNGFFADRLYVPQKGFPKFIKEIQYINFSWGGPRVCAFTHDLSKVTISAYDDNGSKLSDIEFAFWNNIKKKDVKFGKIICETFRVSYNKHIESITIPSGCTIEKVDLNACSALTRVTGKFENAKMFMLPKILVVNMLAEKGIIPFGSTLEIFG